MKVMIPYNVYEEVMFYVNKSDVEVSMMAKVKVEYDTFYLTKVYLLEQENTSATTDLDATAVSKLLYESREDEGNLNCWIHSHANMGVFWSGTDMSTIKKLGDKGYLLSLVFNKKHEVRAAYWQGNDGFKPALFVDEIDVDYFSPNITKEVRDKWEEQFKAKCKVKEWDYSINGIDKEKLPYIKGQKNKEYWFDKNYDNSDKDQYHFNPDYVDGYNDDVPTCMEDEDFYKVDWKKVYPVPKNKKREGKNQILKDVKIYPAVDRKAWYDDFKDTVGRKPYNAKELERFYNDWK